MSTVQRASIKRSVRAGLAEIATVQFSCLVIFTLIEVTGRWPGAYLPMLAAVAGMIFGRDRIRFPAPFWWGIVLLAWALITSFFALSQDVALDKLYILLKVMLIFLVVMNAVRTEKQLWAYLLVILVAFLIYPARGTILNYIHGDLTDGRVAWNYIYDNPNDLAGITLLVLGPSLSIATAAVQSRVIRWSASVAAAILILLVFLTESRGGVLGLVIGVGPPLLLRTMKRPMIAVYALVVLSVGLAALPDSLWVRLYGLRDLTSTSTLSQADKYGSAEQRWEIQKTAWQISIDNPMVGVGLGCYPLANSRYRPDLGNRDTHDTYLNLTAELGVPGLLLWLTLILSGLRQVQRAERSHSKLKSIEPIWLKYGLFGFLIEGIFGTYSGLSILYLVLGTMWSGATLMLEESAKPTVRSVARVT